MMDSIVVPSALAPGQLAQSAVNIVTVWIVVAVVLVVLLLALIVGLVTARRRRVSLREEEPQPEEPKPDAARKRYQGTGQISFSAGTSTVDRPKTPTAEPAKPAPPTPAKPAPPTPVTPAPPRPVEPRKPVEPPAKPVEPTKPVEPPAPRKPVVPSRPIEPPAPTRPVEPPRPTEPAEPGKPTGPDVPEPPAPPVEPLPPTEPTVPPTPEPAPPAPPVAEPIAPPEGRLHRLRGRLSGSRSAFGQGLLGLLGGGDLDEESWEDIEDSLLTADLGAETTTELVTAMRTEVAARGVRTPEQARQMLRDVLVAALRPELDRAVRALPHDGRPAIVLVAGVNGTGKTTTTGKLARVLVAGGRTVVLGAADTFRAAAAEQLVTWGERAGASVVRGKEGADPASVAFEAVKRAAEDGADAVLLDTAGRLHTKTGLMDELGKVKRVVSRQGNVDEVLLVLDATTGQNGLLQAKVFSEVIDVTGIVLTKLDEIGRASCRERV